MKKNSKGLLVAIASFAMVSALAFGPVAAYAQNYNVNIEKDQANVAVADRTFAAYKLFNATPEKMLRASQLATISTTTQAMRPKPQQSMRTTPCSIMMLPSFLQMRMPAPLLIRFPN